jgi:flagellar motor switch protein FliG
VTETAFAAPADLTDIEKSAQLRDKVLRNLSQRAAQMLREEIEARGPMRQAEIEHARKQILVTAQALETEGKIVLRAQENFVA